MDDPFDLVRRTFAPDLLQVAPAHLVSPLRISDRSKRFLTTVGLPREVIGGGGVISINRLDTLLTLRQLFPAYAARIDPAWEDCPFLALDDEGAGFVLSQADGGSVWSVHTDSAHHHFVNSNVESLGIFLAELTPVGRMPASEDFLLAVSQMEKRMAAIDPRAVADNAVYWPSIIEDAQLFGG